MRRCMIRSVVSCPSSVAAKQKNPAAFGQGSPSEFTITKRSALPALSWGNNNPADRDQALHVVANLTGTWLAVNLIIANHDRPLHPRVVRTGVLELPLFLELVLERLAVAEVAAFERLVV